MVTIVTEVGLKQGAEGKWDEIMRERMSAAKDQPGWIGGQLLRPADDPGRRVIVGTWRSRDDWHAWHSAPRFQETRARLDGLVRGPEEHTWHDVVIEMDGEATDSGRDRA
jgi:heme-degrading monooxygenase HmoA